LEKFPLGIKKPLKQGKLNFSWLLVCNINLGVFQPRGKHYFSGLGEALGFHQVKNTHGFSQQKLWDSKEALWSVYV
jgi:hypothetical protein